jgi:divalent metal cation (Fe/Co/Zn/Cd) transporter
LNTILLARVAQIAQTVYGVRQVPELRGEYIGPDMVHLELHVTVAPDASIKEAHRIADEVRSHLAAEGGWRYCTVRPSPISHADVVDVVRQNVLPTSSCFPG